MAANSDASGTVITATEASRSFASILDRVESGERFLIERHGHAVCVMASPTTASRTASECLLLLRDRSPVLLDDRFGEDLLDVVAHEPRDVRPWDS